MYALEMKELSVCMAGYVQMLQRMLRLVLEAVADKDLWIWHAFLGMAGSHNDINVL
jgi:hypothetical protein